MLTKFLFILLGSITLVLGVIGIVIPGLPTTPFLLITAWCYVRSSDRLYNWLINHKIFGTYIKSFNNGFSRKNKIISISIMWVMIFLSVVFFINTVIIIAIVVAVGIIGTIVMSLLKEPRKEMSTNYNKLKQSCNIKKIENSYYNN
jgi:uncharacterized protein